MCVEMEPLDKQPANQPLIWLVTFLVATIGNVDLLVTLIKHKNTRRTCLINLAVGNILATVCLPINYIYQFHNDCGLQFPTYMAFWILRDIATGVQIFSVAVFSALRLSNLQPHRYESVSTSTCKENIAEGSGVATHGHNIHRIITVSSQTFAIWFMAICYSLSGTVTSYTPYYIQNGDTFEDANTKRIVILHCLSFCIIPMILTIFFYILSECQRCNSPDNVKMKDEGRLVFWLICTITINYVPLHSWLLYSWSQYRIVTMAVVDFATYFPLYSTASWIPVVLYFVASKCGVDSSD
jgi:hypothetical protein